MSMQTLSGPATERATNELETYFLDNTGPEIQKFAHYFPIYDRHLARFRDRPVTVLEIGVSEGGSMLMWRHYFGPRARIYGVDIDPRCKAIEQEQIQVFIGSQTDRTFLRELRRSLPPIDVLIDDGGHSMLQQRATFEELFDHVAPDGIYICEDVQTSYLLRYGGGHRYRRSFMEFTKGLIDQLHAFHSDQPNSFGPSTFTRTVTSIHYYDSMIVIEKGKHEPSEMVSAGAARRLTYPPYREPLIYRAKLLVRQLMRILNV